MNDPDPATVFDALQTFLMAMHADMQDAGLERLVEMELTLSQSRLIMILGHDCGPLPINEMAGRLRLSLAATGRNVEQLVRAGLVDRAEDERDRRIKRISLSQHGREQVRQFLALRRSRAVTFLGRLNPRDRARLLTALTPILIHLETTGRTQEPIA